MSRDQYYRVLFASALIFNVLASIVFWFGFDSVYLFMEGSSVPDEPLLHMFIQFVSLAILAFGVVYFVAGLWRDRLEGRVLLALSGVVKVLFVGIILMHTLAGNISWVMPVGFLIDLIYAVLFFECLYFQLQLIKRQSQQAT